MSRKRDISRSQCRSALHLQKETPVERRMLGKTGLTVSEIGMGTWELGGREWGHVDEDEAARLLKHAFERGITLYDTSDQYGGGRVERLLGQAFAGLGGGVGI